MYVMESVPLPPDELLGPRWPQLPRGAPISGPRRPPRRLGHRTRVTLYSTDTDLARSAALSWEDPLSWPHRTETHVSRHGV